MTHVPKDALELRESGALNEGALGPDGSVLVHALRPGVGKGRGNHLYTAEVLARDAHKLGSWKRCYLDHLSESARRASGGLPRSVRDLGGRIVDSWWDGNVPADPSRGYGKGAIVAKVKPTPFVRELVENDPEILEASISTNATGVKPTTQNGQRVWLVEGIEDRGSLDFVSEAGAGGKVVSIMESVFDDDEQEEMTILESMTDSEFTDYLRAERPELLEAITNPEGEDMGEVTPEAVQEALQSEAVQGHISKLVDERVAEKLAERTTEPLDDGEDPGELGESVRDQLRALIQEAVEEERELIHAEARASGDRQLELRDFRDSAHKLINESRLPDAWKAEAKAKFDLVQNQPTEALDVIDLVDDEGNVTKPATEVLREAVDTEITRQRDLLAAVSPTRVRGQGPTTTEGEEGDQSKSEGTYWGSVLQEAGFSEPDKVYTK